MEFPPELQIKNTVYTYIDTQRGGISAIYKAGNSYLRIGDTAKINKDLSFHKKMEGYGFPVPKILEEGTADNFFIFCRRVSRRHTSDTYLEMRFKKPGGFKIKHLLTLSLFAACLLGLN